MKSSDFIKLKAIYLERVEIIDASDDAVNIFGVGHGSSYIGITPKQIESLLSGEKILAISDGEYSTFIGLVNDA